MLAELIECQKAERVSDKLAKMFLLLSERYARKPGFSGYTYKDEMISHALLACISGYQHFDTTRYENVFAYFTSCIHRAFLQILIKEKQQQRIRDSLLVDAGLDPSYSYTEFLENQENNSKNENSV